MNDDKSDFGRETERAALLDDRYEKARTRATQGGARIVILLGLYKTNGRTGVTEFRTENSRSAGAGRGAHVATSRNLSARQLRIALDVE